MKKQDSVNLNVSDALEICDLLKHAGIVISGKKEEGIDFPNFGKYAKRLENEIEKYWSSELVCAGFNGQCATYYTYWKKEIDLTPVLKKSSNNLLNTNEFYVNLAEYFENKGLRDHAEYVRDNIEVLDRQYLFAYDNECFKNQNDELEKLKADKHVGRGYGEDSAKTIADLKIKELESDIITQILSSL